MSVIATSPPSMTIMAESLDGELVEIKLDEGDFSRDRIDVIYSLGVGGEVCAAKGDCRDGAAAMFPEPPVIPPDGKVIAQIRVKAESTFVTDFDITNIEEGVARTGEVPAIANVIYLDPTDPFDRLIIPMVEMNRKKRADYATQGNLFANFDRNAEMMNMPGYTALEDCLSMVGRKFNRITNLRGRPPKNETVLDSFLDLAVYGVLAYGLAMREAEQQRS